MVRDYRNKKRMNPLFSQIANVLLQITRYLLGGVFIFSGFVKAIDPLGSTYKIEDYLNAFGGVYQGLTFLAFFAAILLSTIEIVIGLNLIFKVHIRRTIIFTLLYMMLMTPLTLYIALNNPVTDCGCFGDALIISNWATFWKNIVLVALIIILLIFHKKFHTFLLPRIEWIAVSIFIFIGVGLSVYSYQHLPMIDFRPYKVGVNIPEAMTIPDGAKLDVYKTTFIYTKNGVQKEFTLENYPKGDSAWKFVDQKTVLISKGFKAPVHDFSIVDAQYDDITDQILSDPGYTFLLVMYDVSLATEKGVKKTEDIYKKALAKGMKFYALTASPDIDIQNFVKEMNVTYPFCKTDPITLKTIIRANPGLMLIKDGTILGKWNWRDFKHIKILE